MNSISEVKLFSNCHLILYADDIVMFKPIDSSSDLKDFQHDLTLINQWIEDHGLHTNHPKTQFLPISHAKSPPNLSISLNGHQIRPCTDVKYLGVTITSNLSWSQHISNLTKSTKRVLGRIHRNYHGAPAHLRHKIYQTTILPKLDYCSSVWDPHQNTYISNLEKVQQFASKIITQDWSSNPADLYKSLNLYSLQDRRHIQKLKLTYKILNNQSCIPSHVFTSHPQPSPLQY